MLGENLNISQGLKELEEVKYKPKYKPKYEAMLLTASVITKFLEEKNIQPVIVGGLSVEITTQSEYTTRDIPYSLKFKKVGKR